MAEITLTAADHRRAAALIVHHSQSDLSGINAVLAEVGETDRSVEIILAVLTLYESLVPAVHTDLGQQFLGAHLIRLAGMEDQS